MRKLATAAAVSLVLSSGGVRALGLGDIEMRSALNQPMNAEIRLTSVQPGEAEGMIVKLASQEAFQRAGIDRSQALTDLRFSVDQSSGVPVIAISSSRPVVEPFLNFLLEVDWPAGRMVREYTVLLDPPVFLTPSANSQPAAEQPAILQRSDNTLSAPAPIDRSSDITFSESDFEVEVVGSAVEIADNAVLPGELITNDVSSVGTFTPDLSTDGGEVVSLDDIGSSTVASTLDGGVGTVELIDDTLDPFSADGGEVVVLSDLGAPNDDAAVQFQEEQFVAASDFQFEVEVVGSDTEVADSFRVEGDQFAGSETVSLDSLDSSDSVGVSNGADVTVQRGDTLLSIATANAAPGVSPQQMMIALLNANQSAFINGNVNLVKAGAILRIPDSGEVSQLSQAQAVAQLGEQNQLWREYRDNIRGSSGTRIASTPSAPPQAPEAEAETGGDLSAAAQRILDAATEEALNRQDLSIVAQNESSTTSASATADNSEGNEQAQLGEINKKLQLAKEELASTRLETADLSEQSADLQNTTENQEALVAIRQQEVASLQQQLAQADSDAEGISDNDLLANAQNAVADAGDSVTDAAGSVLEGGENALTAAGEQLGTVELVEDEPVLEAEAVAEAEVEPANQNTSAPWYLELLQKYGKWIIIGIGALSALFAGMLLLGRRKKKTDDRLDYDDVEFFDEEDADVDLHAEGTVDKESSGIGSAVAAGAAGAAAVGGAAAVAGASGSASASAEEGIDDQEAFNADMDSVGTNEVGENIDPDDTVSEVDVYLAYGLHGQAEELLAKAIEREPNNAEYAFKLLQTQHAQGNSEAFAEGAESYHERFGGENSPSWAAVCDMGYDLTPNNALFAGSAESVENVGVGASDSEVLGDNDFMSDTQSEPVGSISRDFGDAADVQGDSEVDLMDQSLDPAFAFDETDLEATGDFSQIADEIASEDISVDAGSLDTGSLTDDTSLDFPGFDATESLSDQAGGLADAGKGKLGDAASSLKGGIGGIGALAAGGAAAAAGGLASKAASAKDGATDMFDDALSLDDLDSAGSAANDGLTGSVSEDLTLDLDQLSGDIELDGADLLDQTSTEALDDLQIPDLTGDNELFSDNVATVESSDEMDTMMDLAKAYIDMGDKDSASSALGEIVKSGNPAQVSEAEILLRKIS